MANQIDALESKYRKHTEASKAAILQGDAKAANRNYDKLVAIGPKLRAFGTQGEAILRRLMKDRSDAIATNAACDSLSCAEAEALEVLDAIARKKGLIAFDAMMIAKQWRAGELKIC